MPLQSQPTPQPPNPDPFSLVAKSVLLAFLLVLDIDGEQLYDLDEDQLNEGE